MTKDQGDAPGRTNWGLEIRAGDEIVATNREMQAVTRAFVADRMPAQIYIKLDDPRHIAWLRDPARDPRHVDHSRWARSNRRDVDPDGRGVDYHFARDDLPGLPPLVEDGLSWLGVRPVTVHLSCRILRRVSCTDDGAEWRVAWEMAANDLSEFDQDNLASSPPVLALTMPDGDDR